MRKWPSLLWERHLLEEQQMLARGVEGPLTVLFWRRGFGPGTWGGAVARAPTGRREPTPPPSLPSFRPTPIIAQVEDRKSITRSMSAGVYGAGAGWEQSCKQKPSITVQIPLTLSCPIRRLNYIHFSSTHSDWDYLAAKGDSVWQFTHHTHFSYSWNGS